MLRHFFYQQRAVTRAGDSPWSPAASDGHPNPKNGTYSAVIDLTEADRRLPLSVLCWVYPPPDWTRGSGLDVVQTDAYLEYFRGVLRPETKMYIAPMQVALAGFGASKVMDVTDPRERLHLIYLFLSNIAPPGEREATFRTVMRNLFPPEEPAPADPPPRPVDLIGGTDLPEPIRAEQGASQ